VRGYSVVALDRPKHAVNIGCALRAAACYGAALVLASGERYNGSRSDTMRADRHMPFLNVADLLDSLPLGCVPVAVDLVEGATPLEAFTHPERAMYIFGPEDGTLPAALVSSCQSAVYIRTKRCMNLGACVNVVLYDRCAKRGEWPAP
jgi:tRNA(Leu) C34 or U34 (ribose-2'-O)-methylase TrmL